MPAKHSWLEDMLAMLTATCLVSLGIVFFNQPGLVVGGTAGLALLLHKLLPFSFGQLFFMLNVPFYWLAWKRLGGQFVAKTLLSVTAVSFFGDHLHQWMQINQVRPIYAALMGSILVGVGLLILFRHRASLGGFNIVCLWLQERYGISAGKVQMGLDCSIVLSSAFITSWSVLLMSVSAAVIVNVVLATNHKPGRYNPAAA
ncbi:YitT family protein [uncultured Tolumonas sp.]|uniref:YitT family protein n=1 Tax=uncultured Tolumonas sp. TaxID=263765 RepID=UPI0029304E3B|nr:YitT family protein [uncultured Tolumonas sp.]